MRTTVGRITLEYSVYGQILQLNRDPVQLRVTVTDAEGGRLRTDHFDLGNGDSTKSPDPLRCDLRYVAMGDSDWYTYRAHGLYQTTVIVTTSICDPSTGGFRDDQTASVTIPVLVCQRIDVVDGDVQCTTP